MPRSGWHRVLHPLCGADLATLLRLIAQNGLPSTVGSLRLGIALASSIGRLPFTLAERAWTALAQHRPRPAPPPIFIVGHMRSGTTHLHNLLAASGQFATVPPVVAGMPWEALGLARVLRPFVEQYLPEDRLIDSVRVRSDSPTEDEIALANMHPLSCYHAMYFPRRFEETYRRGLLLEGAGELVRWQRTLRPYVGKMSALGEGRSLLLKSPDYAAQIRAIRALWPDARFVHIYRDPYVVFASTCRALRTVLRELALQPHEHVPVDEVVLELYPRIMGRCSRKRTACRATPSPTFASRSSSGTTARSSSPTMKSPGRASKPICVPSSTTPNPPTPSRRSASDGSANDGNPSSPALATILARSRALRRVTDVILPPLHELEPAPRRKGFRTAPLGWAGPADAASPVFHIDAAQLWQVWLASAAGRPRTVLRAKDEQHRRSLHVQRSPVFRFSDLVRAEVMPLGIQRSSLILDSRARFGCWDFGVNRRRVLRWVHDLQQGHGIWRYGIVRMDVTGLRAVQALALRRIEVRLKQHY